MVATTADKVTVELEARTARYLANINNAERQFARRMQLMSSSADVMERRVARASDRMSLHLGRAISAIAVYAAIKNTQELADAWTSSANKLAAAGVEMDKVNGTQQRLADLARETRSEFASTADLYAKLTRATATLGANQAQVARATETINKAMKAGGASTNEQISSILQLSQALGSGNLQGDELRSIRENAPLLARAIAKEFDTTVAGLKKLGAEGELTSDRVFKAILEGSKEIDAQFERTRSTIGEAFTALRTEAGRFLNEFDRATGATQGISEFVNKVADDFDLLAQAVIVSSAVVSTALGVRLVRSLGQAAYTNSEFVRSVMNGTVGLNLQAEAARKAARETLLVAQADREASRQGIVAVRQKIAALQQEAQAYRQNIALAEAQRAVAARQVETGRNASGVFVSRTAARSDRDNATKAIIANRMQLTRVTRDLAAAEGSYTAATNTYTVAAARATAAQTAMNAAMVTTSVVSRAAAVAIRGLSAAMAFFGGPIGLAIIAVAGALTYFATEAAKAKAASENVQAILDELEISADETRQTVGELSKNLEDNKTAADKSAQGARNAASAYDAAGAAAANAAEMIKYMTAAQRQSQLVKMQDALTDLNKSVEGFNPFATNDKEAVENARRRVLRTQGLQGGGAFAQSEQFIRQAQAQVKNGTATAETAEAVLEYNNALAVLNDKLRQQRELEASIQVVRQGISAPTLERPNPSTSNLIPPDFEGDGGSGSGGSRGRGRQGPSPEELSQQREMLDLQNRINVARAAGAEELAQFLEDQQTLIELAERYADAGLSGEQAQARAQAYVDELRAARELAKAQEAREEAEKQAAKDLEDAQDRELDRQRQLQWLEENRLLVQLESARVAGNSERVRELERQLELLQRIREYEDFGGLPPEEARRRGEQDQGAVNTAENIGKVRDLFKGGLEAALDGDLSKYLEDFWHDALVKANNRAIDKLFDALEQVFDQIDLSGLFKTPGGGVNGGGIGEFFSNLMDSAFGGGRAGGGLMQPGRVYKVGENGPEYVSVTNTARAVPNSSYRADQQGGGGGGLTVQVVNQTGVAASAQVERTPTSTKVTLQPMFEQGVQGAGQSGALRKGLMASPRPVRRA